MVAGPGLDQGSRANNEPPGAAGGPGAARSTRQYSLRMLVVAISLVAVLFGIGRTIGFGIGLTIAFFAASIVPFAWRRATWRRGYGLAWSALYLPFVVTAVFTLLYVPCDHCKETTWSLLPCGPGLIPVGLVVRLLRLSNPVEQLWFTSAFFVSAAGLVAMTWLLARLPPWTRIATVLLVTGGSSVAAYLMLAMIRA